MNKLFLLSIFLLLSSIVVYAQIDIDSITKSGAKCGNGIREPYESCDKSSNSTDKDICPQIGNILKTTLVCNPDACACFQPRKTIRCGDKHTTGTEICDPPGTDFCPKVAEFINISLECNKDTCSCKAPTGAFVSLASDVKPAENLTKSLCGNRQIDESEHCDPPGRMCSFAGTIGICSDDCKCKEVDTDAVNTVAENLSNATTPNDSVQTNVTVQSESENKDDKTVYDSKISEIVDEKDSGVSDTTYTVVLIVLVVVFIVGLAVGSFFIYKRSQIGGIDSGSSENIDKKE